MNTFLEVFMQRREELVQLLLEHIQMTSAAVLISICIGIPLGILVTKNKKVSSVVIGIANIMQSIPSIGLLAFLVPVVGIGQKPAIIMVIIYALLPIIKNTYIGITGIQQSAIESASSIGLTKWRILYKIQIPIAMPYIMAGVRISAVTAVGTVTIAAFAGAGGLGWLINLGLNANDADLVLLGALPACLLALVVDFVSWKSGECSDSGRSETSRSDHKPYKSRTEKTNSYGGLSSCPDPGSSMFHFCIQCVPEKRRENRNWQ